MPTFDAFDFDAEVSAEVEITDATFTAKQSPYLAVWTEIILT